MPNDFPTTSHLRPVLGGPYSDGSYRIVRGIVFSDDPDGRLALATYLRTPHTSPIQYAVCAGDHDPLNRDYEVLEIRGMDDDLPETDPLQ